MEREGVGVVRVRIEFLKDIYGLLLESVEKCVKLIGDVGVFIVIGDGINWEVRKGCWSSCVLVYFLEEFCWK